MEKHPKKRSAAQTEADAEMNSTTTDDLKQDRKIKVAKRKAKPNAPIIDKETGEQIEMDGETSSDEGEYMDGQEVVQEESGDDWEDEAEMMNNAKNAKKADKRLAKEPKQDYREPEEDDEGEIADVVDELPNQIWNDQEQPLKEDEEMEYDSSAYQMLHRANVEWPCLSIDPLIKDRLSFPNTTSHKEWFPSQMNGVLDPANSTHDAKLDTLVHNDDKYPMSVYFTGGSQCENPSDNKIYVMKWFDMAKTLHDDKEVEMASDDDEDDMIEKMNANQKEPIIRFESIPHRGAVNRIRSLHGSSIVATWSDEAEVGIYNVSTAITQLDLPVEDDEKAPTASKKKKKNKPKKQHGGCKIAGFKHKSEGYALEWSPNTFGRLASGSCDAHLWLYSPSDENCSSFVKET